MFSPDSIRVWHSSNSILHTPPSQHSRPPRCRLLAEHTSELMMSGSVIFIVEIFHRGGRACGVERSEGRALKALNYGRERRDDGNE